jgi:RHS repeat-associated protein
MTEETSHETSTLAYDGRGFLAKARNAVTDCGPLVTIPTYGSGGLLYQRQQQNLFTSAVTVQTRVFYLAGRPVAQLDGAPASGVLTYLTVDHLGTPILASTGAATATWSGGFEPFGRDFTIPTALSSGIFLRLPGQWDDTVWDNMHLSSGLYYNVNRWYGTAGGRYLEPDPIRPAQRFGILFGYALSRPTRFADPLGLFVIDKSCDNLGCLPQHGYGSLLQQLKQETTSECATLEQTIYGDVALLRCLHQKCDTGKINCRMTGDKDPFNLCNQPNKPGGWGPVGGDANLCPANWTYGVPPGYLGETVIHEWAHNCKWRHGEGKGVPHDSGSPEY